MTHSIISEGASRGEEDLRPMFYPRGVAVIGSASEGKLGYELIRQMLAGGYDHRRIFAVNPRAQGVFDVAGYDAVAKIAAPVDLAVVVSPPATVPAVLTDCGQAGVPTAVIITAGFSEVGNRDGEEEVTRVARQYGLRFIGPNCAGMLNTTHRLYPTLETRPPAGGVAVVAQSGAVGGVMMAWAREFGLGISKFISYGNRADLNEIDFLRYLAGDAETQVVALYIESASGGREFMEAVRECTRQKPVVVIKAGRTQSGQRATLSHTGSLAGSDAVYDAALRQCGAIRVHTIEEMFDLCQAFVSLRPPTGRRVAIVTNSGGPGVLAADRAEELGLDVAEPGPALKERLAEFLPPHCAFKNPIDLTVEGSEAGYRETLRAVLQEYDAALALNIATPYLDSVALARGVGDAARQSEKPVMAAFLPRAIVASSLPVLDEWGVPNFATGERAIAALARMVAWREHRESQESTGVLDVRPAGMDAPVPAPPTVTLEPGAMAWLQENGIAVPPFRFVGTEAEAVESGRELGYPLVMKIVSPDVLHKSDVGGVLVGIGDDEALRKGFQNLKRIAERRGFDFRGVILYPLIRDAQEVLIGLSRDPQFGPVVAFGLGGIYAEVWRDVALRVAPIGPPEAQAMIREIRSYPLLTGIRGYPPRDIDALVDILVAVSRLPFRYPDIVELDLNPVFLLEQGRGVMAGDVRVILDSR